VDSWLTDTVTVVGGVVGAAGLGVGWFSARDTHWDRRYERLIAIEQEARARGPLTEGDTDASENAQAAHAQFLQNLDREIRTQQAAQLRAARRVTGGASTGTAAFCIIYGAILAWLGSTSLSIKLENVDDSTAAAFSAWFAAGLFAVSAALLARGVHLVVRRIITREIRSTIGLRDTYSVETARLIWRNVRRLGRSSEPT